jgi:broad specificity phosphatase PhoE
VPTILLVRHAQASFGATDYDVLSERGAAQVAALVEGLARRGITADRVVCGSLRRQLDTAGPCAAAAGVEVEVDPRFNEYDDADVIAHHSTSDVRLERRPGDEQPRVSSREFQEILDGALRSWVAAGASGPAGTPWPAFLDGVTGALRDLAGSLGSGQTAIAVTSGGVLGAVCATLMGLAPESFVAFNHVSVNAAISKVVVGRGGTTLVTFNDHAHLEEAGDSSLITYR